MFLHFPVAPWGATGLLLALATLSWGVWLILRRTERALSAGLLIVLGWLYGALPSVISGASNRYFVTTISLWLAAVLLLIDHKWDGRRTKVWGLTAVAMLLVWRASLPASDFRTHAAPNWQNEVARVREVCAPDPGAQVDLRFSPDWPPSFAQHLEPTTTHVLCFKLR